MWMPPTPIPPASLPVPQPPQQPPAHPHTHTTMHYHDHSQTGLGDRDTRIDDCGYESFYQCSSAAQLPDHNHFSSIFEQMQTTTTMIGLGADSNSNHIARSKKSHVNGSNVDIEGRAVVVLGGRRRMDDMILEEVHGEGDQEILDEEVMEMESHWPALPPQDSNARNSKSSQLPSRAHSRSPAPSSNLADNHEARRTEGPWRCLAEAPLAPQPPPFPAQGGGGLASITLKSPALSGNPHNIQHRSVGQYKELTSQSKRLLKSSVSLDSLRCSLPHSQNYYSVPQTRSSSTTTASSTTPVSSTNTSTPPSLATITTRDQVAVSTSTSKPSGVDKKNFQTRLRRRPSAQLLSSTSILDRLKLEDTMMAHPSQHMQSLPHDRMTGIEDIPSQNQILDKYRAGMPYGEPLPLSPPPSATRPEFIGNNSVASYHLHEDSGLSFNNNEMGMTRPHSMSSLRGTCAFSEATSEESAVRRLNDHLQELESAAEPSMYMRQSSQMCWAPPNWLAAEIPQPLDMGAMGTSPEQSPTTQQWVGENGEIEDGDSSMHLRISSDDGMPLLVPGMNHPQNSFRLASPPTGRGIHRMPSCPTFRGSSLSYQEQPPSPALEEHGISNLGYMERSCSNSSSIPSPPESPHFVYPSNSQLSTSALRYPVTPLVNQDGFPTDVYTHISESQHNIYPQLSKPDTPRSSRTSSRHIPPIAAAAAAAALAATKTSSKTAKNRSSRRIVSSSNGRGSSSRNNSTSSVVNGNGRPGGPGLGDSGEMPFVNFTPQDATRILSGVAPSGSSKTKARREREALEKRRKLSEAAAAAVIAAGGDTSQLPELLKI
ncbi:hypothetical protein BDZ91DRAFT_786200 [Kalaharituber pfeilii]|nr:hypothetical protein BDZ91DRAFT_786200 [Kalaharituber pfeilii]